MAILKVLHISKAITSKSEQNSYRLVPKSNITTSLTTYEKKMFLLIKKIENSIYCSTIVNLSFIANCAENSPLGNFL